MRRPSMRTVAKVLVPLLLLALLVGNPWTRREYHLWRGASANAAHDLPAALDHAEAALALFPHDPRALLLSARAHPRIDRPAGAHQAHDRLLALDPSHEAAHRERLLVFAQSGDLGRAEPFLAQLMDAPAEQAHDACEAFVRGYMRNLRFVDALRLIEGWMADAPGAAEPYFLRGYVHWTNGDPDQAAADFAHGLELDPHRWEMRLTLGQLLLTQGKPTDAIDHFERVLEVRPAHSMASLGLAEAYIETSQSQRAEARLERFLPSATAGGSAWGKASLLLARVAFDRNEPGTVIELLEPVARRRPYDSEARYLLAQALQQVGRSDEAQPHLDYLGEAGPALNQVQNDMQVASRYPTDIEIRERIARNLSAYGAPQDAVRWWRSVAHLQPGHEEARQELERLGRILTGAAEVPDATPSIGTAGP